MTVYSLDYKVEIPRAQNLGQLLHTSAYDLPDSHIIAADSLTNRSVTLGELRDRAGRIAQGFKQKLNPPHPARWAIILPNSVEFLEFFQSILWIGSVVCPINYALKAIEILQYLHIPDSFLVSERLEIPNWPDTTKQLASIHLSSETTGKPMGVCLTHFNFVANVPQLVSHDTSQFHPASKTVAFTPWADVAMTTMPMFLGPYTGMFHRAMPSYNLETFAKLVGSSQATSFQGVPSVVLSLAKSDVTERYDFSRAAILNVGGAPFKKGDLKRLMSRAPWNMIRAYGMTETAGYGRCRTKGLIKYKRLQVSPSKLESYINSHPDVAESGVAALWDETQLTELPTVWVILKPHMMGKRIRERTSSLEGAQKWIDGQVSGYKKLRGGVGEVERLPKNATGKMLQKEMVGMRDGLCSLDRRFPAKLESPSTPQ